MSENILEIRNLKVMFGKSIAIHNVSLTVPKNGGVSFSVELSADYSDDDDDELEYWITERKTVEAINAAPAGGSLTIPDMCQTGLSSTVVDAMMARRNVNFIFTYNVDGVTYRITVPAGYICSSSYDLGRYLQMYLRGGEGIISSDSIHSMFYNSVYVEDDIPYSYGMGWNVIEDTLSEPVIYHTGLVETGMTCIYLLPDSDIGVALTVNANDYLVGTDFADRVGWAVIEILTGDEHGEIGEHEYLLRHLMFDAIYLAVFATAVISLTTVRSKKNGAVSLVLLHLVLPLLLLILTPVFFSTPLWW